MKKWLGRFLWLAVGAVAGWAGSLIPLKKTEEPWKPRSEYTDDSNWLFNEETTLDEIFPTPGLANALRLPERIELHRIGGNGGIEVDGRLYDSEGRIPSPEIRKQLSEAFVSLNAYQIWSGYTFQPEILVRITSDGRTYDMEFCFDCHAIRSEGESFIGMSKEGAEVFLRCCSETFPEFKELEQLRPRNSLSIRYPAK